MTPVTDLSALIVRLRRLEPQLLSLCDLTEDVARRIADVISTAAATSTAVVSTCPECERRRRARAESMRRWRAGKRIAA
jgi:hypothetical protein